MGAGSKGRGAAAQLAPICHPTRLVISWKPFPESKLTAEPTGLKRQTLRFTKLIFKEMRRGIKPPKKLLNLEKQREAAGAEAGNHQGLGKGGGRPGDAPK